MSSPSTLIWSHPLEEETSVFISALHKVELRLTNLSQVTQLEPEPSSFVQTLSELDPPGWMEARGFSVFWNGRLTLGKRVRGAGAECTLLLSRE